MPVSFQDANNTPLAMTMTQEPIITESIIPACNGTEAPTASVAIPSDHASASSQIPDCEKSAETLTGLQPISHTKKYVAVRQSVPSRE